MTFLRGLLAFSLLPQFGSLCTSGLGKGLTGPCGPTLWKTAAGAGQNWDQRR